MTIVKYQIKLCTFSPMIKRSAQSSFLKVDSKFHQVQETFEIQNKLEYLNNCLIRKFKNHKIGSKVNLLCKNGRLIYSKFKFDQINNFKYK